MGKTFKEKPDKWRKQLNGKKNKKHHNGWKPMGGSMERIFENPHDDRYMQPPPDCHD